MIRGPLAAGAIALDLLAHKQEVLAAPPNEPPAPAPIGQLFSTAAHPLPFVLCGVDLPPGHRALCLACVERVKAERAGSR